MNFKKIFFLFLSISILFRLNAQQANNWYFGNNAGITFNTPSPTALNSGLTANVDNSSTISDMTGALLFYTDGMKVWDKNHAIMPNGNGLIGHFSGGQCALIVPIPCDPNKYVIFHVTEFSSPGNLNYTVVDMTLNSGLGDVVAGQKNISLGTGWTEKLCAYYNPNGNYYWVLSHKWQSNQFVAFKVDATTIATQSVTSSIGSVHNCGTFGGAHDAMGQLTISPDGNKVVNALTCQDKFELFDLNINTGVLSNFISIPGNGGNAWGTAFSPNSQKLYTNSIFGQSVFQYDLSTYNQAAIIASKNALYTAASTGYNFGYMELGPDNKLYIAKPNSTNLTVVNNPDNLGPLSNFSLLGPSLSPKTSYHGLSRIAYNIPTPSASFSISASVTSGNCSNGSATITPSTNTLILTYSWSPGNYTTSSVSNLPLGVYTVIATSSTCFSASTQFTVTQSTSLNASVNSPTVCKNTPAQLSATVSGGSPAYSYTWMPGNLNTPVINVSHSSTTVYTLSVKDNGGCASTLTTAINIDPITSNFNFNQNNCSGSFTLNNTSNGAGSYNWNFGDNTTSTGFQPQHTYSSPGTYSISLIANSNSGCHDTIQKNITVGTIVNSNFTAQLNICDTTVTLINNSVGGASYLWRFGDGNTSTMQKPASHTYSTSGTFNIWLVVSNASGCKDSSQQTVSVIKNSTAGFNITSDPCLKQVSVSSTSSYAITYDWQFGDGSISTSSSPTHTYLNTGNYSITLIINAGLTCSATITKPVSINNGPIAQFTYSLSPCDGRVVFSNTSINGNGAYWSFGDNSASYDNDPVHYYASQGIYTVYLTSSPNMPCLNTTKQVIEIKYNSVTADFDFTNPALTYNANFINLSKNAQTFFWDFYDGTSSTQFEPTHTYEQVGSYTVCLAAINYMGCTDTLCKKIDVDAGWTFYVPNTFSPNDDKLNDIFYAYGTNIKDFKISVFDRWGEEIFNSSEIEYGWNGTFRGLPVQDDIYIWKAEFNDLKNKNHSLTGHIQVLR